MAALLILVAIWFGGMALRLSAFVRLCLIAAVWLAVVAALALRPEANLSRAIGGSAEGWLLIGIAFAAILGYRRLLARLRKQAVEVETPVAVPAGGMSDAELDRYARHIVLREIGGPGQGKLRNARVLIVGAGALGSPVSQYLAAAGVGHITIADDDRVSLSNLQRQVIFRVEDIDRPKVDAARDALAAINPHIAVTSLPRRITAEDAAFVKAFDLVLDGTDSFASRQGINAACVAASVPLVAGSIAQWEGQLTIWDPAQGAPCMACIFPEAPAAGLAPSCAEAGVVGALPGVIGSMMALEAIKLITGAGSVSRNRMTIYDGLWGETRTIAIARNPACPVCAGH